MKAPVHATKSKAERYERRLDEIACRIAELSHLRASDQVDESECLQRETALREEFDEVVSLLEHHLKDRKKEFA